MKVQLSCFLLRITFAFLFLWLFVACQSGISPQTDVSTNETVTQQMSTQEVGLSATPPARKSPTSTTFPTALPTETLMPTPTARPTKESNVALPTLSPLDAANTLLGLLQSNADCELPCWWGATPGQTKWNQIARFLRTLDAQLYEPHPTFHEVFLPHTPSELEIQDPLGFHLFYFTENETIRSISIENAEVSNYFLASILTDYGAPEEVLIETMPRPRQNSLPFRLVMIYWERGIAVKLTVEAEQINETIVACFSATGHQNPSLYLWPGEGNPLSTTPEFLEQTGLSAGGEGDYYRALSDVTGFDIDSFYATYREPSENACLETPTELW